MRHLPSILSVSEERHATWLELFYDLVFVVTISQLANYLENHLSLYGFLQFLILFIPVWWSWLGTTFFATRFYSDDIAHRILLIMQMGGAGALSVNIHGAFGDTSSGFASSYAFMRYLLVIEYYRIFFRVNKSKKEPKEEFNHPLVKRYIVGFSGAATVWLISAFIPILEIRFFLWAIGFLIDFATPITAGRLHSQFAPDISHLPERMGAFTLIVLGESIVALVAGMTHQIWNIYSVSVASLGLCISFSIWWLYFPNVRGSAIEAVRKRSKIGIYYTWLYSHFPLVVGITAIGVGIRHLVSKEQGTLLGIGDLWLVCIAISMFLISQIILQFVSKEIDHDHIYRIRKWMLFRIITIAAILLFPIIGNAYATSLFVSFIIISILIIHIILDFLAHDIKRESMTS